MKTLMTLFAAFLGFGLAAAAEDVRLLPLKDLNGYFPFNAPDSLNEWNARKDYVRRQILVAQGLWPMPAKTPLNAVVHGKVDCGDYTVEKAYFESAPGFFVTGNLYRPKKINGRAPAVMFAHGHREDARFFQKPDAMIRQEIADGLERFERAGRSNYQSMSRQFALMGCIVWQWDMLSDSDSKQFSAAVVHRFAKQRPEMNTTENWGLYSPQAESHLQSIMGLQTLNAVRGLDFLLSLPDVDPDRIAITGGSGGGTQTMLLTAIDDRIKLSFPVVMVSTAMQGGCTCESSSLLRVNTGNVEFAALAAPRPQGMNSAGDWTKEMATKGFPDLQKLYSLYGRKDHVFLLRGENYPHGYNVVTRSAAYTFVNKHFKLGHPAPVIETDFELLPREKLTVWDERHPAPQAAGPAFERALLSWLTDDSDRQLRAAATSTASSRQIIRPALEVVIGRTFANAGAVEWSLQQRQDRGSHTESTGTLANTTHRELVKAVWLQPKQWNGRTVVWLDDDGAAALRDASGSVRPGVMKLVQSGAAVIGADLLFQGGAPVKQTRVAPNPREFAGYTFGYNHALFAQRTHDVLTLVAFLRNLGAGAPLRPASIAVAGWGSTGPVVVAARALAGAAIDRAAVETNGFRFGGVLDYRDPMFLPGGSKYLDLPGMMALSAPHPLWLAGEREAPELVTAAYRREASPSALTQFAGESANKETTAIDWLLN